MGGLYASPSRWRGSLSPQAGTERHRRTTCDRAAHKELMLAAQLRRNLSPPILDVATLANSTQVTGVGGFRPAKCAIRLSIINWPMAVRVSTVALPWCGCNSTLGNLRRSGAIRGAFWNT